MEFLDIIHSRRSIRAYTQEPITEAEMETIIKAGMQAPSGLNQQPWRMLSITDRSVLESLIPMTSWWGLLKEAPLAIVVCADTRVLGNLDPEYQICSCAAATENMLLTAHAMGLGAVWLGMCQGDAKYEEFKSILKLPDYARVVSMIAVGHPAKEAPAQDRFDASKWYKETWPVE